MAERKWAVILKEDIVRRFCGQHIDIDWYDNYLNKWKLDKKSQEPLDGTIFSSYNNIVYWKNVDKE